MWNIAKKYNVSFEELKAINTQLSNPDMIMPGMKIKIPYHSAGKKEVIVKESVVQHPFSEKKPHAPPMDYQPVIPQQKPIMMQPEVDIHQTYNVQLLQAQMQQQQQQPQYQVPHFPMPVMPPKELVEEVKEVKEEIKEEIKEVEKEVEMPQMVHHGMCYPISPIMPGDGFQCQCQYPNPMHMQQPQVQGEHMMPDNNLPKDPMMQPQGYPGMPYMGEYPNMNQYPQGMYGDQGMCQMPPGMYGEQGMGQMPPGMYGDQGMCQMPPGMYGDQGMGQMPPGMYGDQGMGQMPPGMYGDQGMGQMPPGMYGDQGMGQFPPGMFRGQGTNQPYGYPGMGQGMPRYDEEDES